MSDDVKPREKGKPDVDSVEYDDRVKAEAEGYFTKVGMVPADPLEKVTARGFVEACADLGNVSTPDEKLVEALEGLRRLTDYGLDFVVISKTTGAGFFAHVLFDSVDRFKAISAERALGVFAALAFEDWPDYALRDGQRAHVFAGVGEEREKKPRGPR